MKRLTNHVVLVCILFGIITFTSCKKEVSLPVLTTNSATNITINSAKSGGNTTSSGGADVTARGVCWSTLRNPVVAAGSSTSDGKGSGSFSSSITGLTPHTQYYVRAYATNSAGTAYGNEVSFTTSEIVVPTLTTTAASDILLTTATAGGNISADGGAAVTARGVCWSTTVHPDINSSTTSDGSGTGTFTSSLAGLTPSTTYYIRAYATNSAGTGYGDEKTFTTAAVVAPTLTTVDISAITLTSAVSGGNITSDGGANVTARGICWATTTGPTTSNSTTPNGSGTGTYACDMTGLTPGTTYYVRAYATNSAGTTYGNELTFETVPVAPATVTTTIASAVTYTTASSGGDVTADGGGTVTAKGICYATTAGPTTANTVVPGGAGLGTFTSSLTGLTPGITYYVRAFATNSKGTAYGNEISFTTNQVVVPTLTTTGASAITRTSATSGGNITSDGGSAVTARGICYATTTGPTTANTVVPGGAGLGTFTSSLTGLTPGITYYVRAYATNSAGTSYGTEVTFTTNPAVAPTLSTAAISAITLTTASSGGNISSDGGAAISEKGVCWSTSSAPTIAGSRTSDGTGTGNFTSSIYGLEPGTTYHVRAYATNSVGTAYGNDVQFTTTALTAPTVTTTPISSITTATAVSGGNITSNGGGIVTVSGICWSTNANPTTADSRTNDGTLSGSFASTMTGLEMGTTYYVRAYATNSAGTAYGNEIIFSTRMADIDGNTYGVTKIGTQVWMTENLRTVTLNTGTAIPNVPDNTDWTLLATMAYSWYNNDAANKPVYGGLYNWFAVNTGSLCPAGWHVPSETEFGTLELYLGMDQATIDLAWQFRGTDQGTRLKNTTGWLAGQNGTNTTGFAALPGGYRYAIDGTFNNYTDLAYWWSSTELDGTQAWYRRLDGTEAGIFKGAVQKRGGKFVRCVKN